MIYDQRFSADYSDAISVKQATPSTRQLGIAKGGLLVGVLTAGHADAGHGTDAPA